MAVRLGEAWDEAIAPCLAPGIMQAVLVRRGAVSKAPRADREPSFAVRIAPLSAAMFLGFLAVSLPLPAVPLQVAGRLGFGTIAAGTAVGAQSFATLLTRAYGGRLVDERGAKHTLVRGLTVAAVAELLLLASAGCTQLAFASFAILLAGRVVLGAGESLLITGILSWAIVRAGSGQAGRAMSWNGMAQYGALALGAPAGFALYRTLGFDAVAVAAAVAPLLALATVLPLHPPPRVAAGRRIPLLGVVGRIRGPGIALMLAGIGFSTIATFASLLFTTRHWPNAGLALMCYGACFVLVRIVGSGWPDRFGGPKVAVSSMGVGALGQALLWLAPVPAIALCGAALTGVGCSLVFPALGVEALKRVPEDSRGMAVGVFAAFQDLAIGGTGPVLGVLATIFGPSVVFLGGAAAAILGCVLAYGLRPLRATDWPPDRPARR